jgi:hypothetical protein
MLTLLASFGDIRKVIDSSNPGRAFNMSATDYDAAIAKESEPLPGGSRLTFEIDETVGVSEHLGG